MYLSKPLPFEKRRVGLFLEFNEFIISCVKTSIHDDQMKNFNLISRFLHLIDMNFNYFHEDCARIIEFYSKNQSDLKSALTDLQGIIKSEMSIFRNFILKNTSSINRNAGSYLAYNNSTEQFEIIVNGGIDKNDQIINQFKYLVSNSYIEMFFYMMPILPANRFGVCPRCDSPFFALTNRPKTYCYSKCSKAASQESYMKKISKNK